MPPSLYRDGEVFVLNLGDDENRWHPDWLAAVNSALDTVEAAEAPRALVTTATGKQWSGGLELDYVRGDRRGPYLVSVQALMGRMLGLPLPTVAAVQGHAFAGGAMLALAHDFRVMRADRGFFCLPEVDLHMSFTPGMMSLIQAKLAPRAAVEATTTGRRYGGLDALAMGIVDATATEDEVLATALDLARPLTGKPSGSLGLIKAGLYAAALADLMPATP